MAGFVGDIASHWYVDLSIPIVAAVIGWVTKLVALRMMFQPLEFVGVRPWFGWQGIVPRRAARMASIAVETMTRDLISARDVVARLDPDEVVRLLEQPMREATGEITREIAQAYRPGLWEILPETARALIVARARAVTPQLIRDVLEEVKSDPDSVFDLKGMVVGNFIEDKALLNSIFQRSGHKEFRFIRRSGIWFGGSIGLLQLVLWVSFHEPLIMPAFGLCVGWFTDWLALKMIFNPKRPIRVFGVTIQGLFLKRRKEVAAEYGALIADEVITPRKVLEAILTGPLSDRMFAVIRRQVMAATDRGTGLARPLVVAGVGTARYQQMKQDMSALVQARLPDTLLHLEDYAEEAMDIRNTLMTKMRALSERQFEALIRPAFEQDEWILITVGAVLGFVMGEAQALVLEHLAH